MGYALFGLICFHNHWLQMRDWYIYLSFSLSFVVSLMIRSVMLMWWRKRHELRSELLSILPLTVNTSESSSSSPLNIQKKKHTHTHKTSSEWRVKNWFNRSHNFLFPFLRRSYKNPSREKNEQKMHKKDKWVKGHEIELLHTHIYTHTYTYMKNRRLMIEQITNFWMTLCSSSLS